MFWFQADLIKHKSVAFGLIRNFYKRRKAQLSGWGNSFIGMDEKWSIFEIKDLSQIVIYVAIFFY